MNERLLACQNDIVSLVSEIQASLSEESGNDSVEHILAFISQSSSIRTDLLCALIDNCWSTRSNPPTDALMDGIVHCIRQDTQKDVLMKLFKHVVDGLMSTSENVVDMLEWGNRIMEIIFLYASQDSEIQDDSTCIAQVLEQLYSIHLHRIHDHPELKLLTFIWKNITKLSTTYPTLVENLYGQENPQEKLILVMVADLESNIEQLIQSIQSVDEKAIRLKQLHRLRLFFRAFCGLFVCFLKSSVSLIAQELEQHLQLVLDVVVALLSFCALVQNDEELSHEAHQLLIFVLRLIERMPEQMEISMQSTISTWSPELICPDRHLTDEKPVYEWSHLLILAAYNSTLTLEKKIGSERPAYVEVGNRLLDQYCHISRSISRTKVEKIATSLFIDSFLTFLHTQASDLSSLQLFLVQALVDTKQPLQRSLLWEIWKEFWCYWLSEDDGSSVLETFFSLMCCDPIATEVVEAIQDLIVVLYPDMKPKLQSRCLAWVTTTIEIMCQEGPTFHPTTQSIASLHLLDKLTCVSFFDEYEDGDAKEEWIASFLPTAVECIGTVLHLIEKQETQPVGGWIRVLDVNLLVIKTIYDLEKGQPQELKALVVPMCTEILTRLTTISFLSPSRVKRQRRDQDSMCQNRLIETCLYLLTQCAADIKRNSQNQCVQVLSDLYQLTQDHCDQLPIATTIVRFLHVALGDVQVARNDGERTWKLYQRLFYKLSSLYFGLEISTHTLLTPSQSSCLLALYTVLSRSNLPEFTGAKCLGHWLVPHAHSLFQQFLAFMSVGSNDALIQVTRKEVVAPSVETDFEEKRKQWNRFKHLSQQLSHHVTSNEDAWNRWNLQELKQMTEMVTLLNGKIM